MIALAACAVAALAVGFFFGVEAGLAAFSAGLLMLLAYHLRNLRALSPWLEHGEAPHPPRARGIWGELPALLHPSPPEAARPEAELPPQLARWRAAAAPLPDRR